MAQTNGQNAKKWWKEAVVYQIYPASFLDTNGDGRGDVNGITAKLDYLKALGVNVIWSSPIYDSPQADMGYDISNYKSIYPPYGTLEDVDRLIRELSARDMKLVMDLVVNHTSNQHAWFLESRASVDNPKRDWYIWKKPKYDASGNRQPPNNWCQCLGEEHSAWIFDEGTQEYYFAAFTPEQPDLNWENLEVRAVVHDVLRFWLDRGVAGFRMDVINFISKDQNFPDAPIDKPGYPYQPGHMFFANGPRLHEFLREMKHEVLDKYEDVFTVGEMPCVSDENEILNIVHHERGFLNMIFHFELVEIDMEPDDIPGSARFSKRKWTISDLRRRVSRWQTVMSNNGGWNAIYCENHDQPRSISHFADDSDEHRVHSSKLLSIMESTLCGTLFVYQGEELGMRNVPADWDPSEYKDIESINYWNVASKVYADCPTKLAHAKRMLRVKARDNGRTPIQWTSEAPNAGFCAKDVTPWMRVNTDHVTVNADAQTVHGTDSVYHFWQRQLKLRKEHPDVFIYGRFDLVDERNEEIFSFVRTAGSGERWYSVLNFTEREGVWTPGEDVMGKIEWVVGNYYQDGDEVKPEVESGKGAKLRPWEGLLGRLVV
ncbi:glycoside hydrolase superfamily [Podospora aff. communis PSN243]|uniref:Glycoside hydrolase superfamily n=1 Tax=Podospora aff. communis PSN243 TaxID=3040156 RepID=A0AAV9H3W8_9PEZI|nr:glycoside hydrolase superfamily [Podospora aff. communis PSN243]